MVLRTRLLVATVLVFLAGLPASARHETDGCGTTLETRAESRFRHRMARLRARPLSASPAAQDVGNIAIIGDDDGAIARPNDFSLDLKTLHFSFTAGTYTYTVSDQGYDAAAAASGTPVNALGDDDTRKIALPFSFPFFGARYNELYLNSDGNLTFTAPDFASNSRSLGRMTSGPPRIAPLFDDLDPSQASASVRVLSDSGRFVVSWVGVPEWQSSGPGRKQTFQVRLYPDGSIEFAYSGVTPASAVTGIAPGDLRGATALQDFRNDPSGSYTAAVAERFGSGLEVDVITVAQKFYASHEDSYDYLVIYNSEDIPTGPSYVALTDVVRSKGTGYGYDIADDGLEYASASRLQAVINMGPISQYPTNPNGPVPARTSQGDTPLSILGHEAGHLFLARVSVPDPNDPANDPMLNAANHVHWRFTFNSEASLLEGERIQDRGAGVSPRFLTTDTVAAYSALDQYLMGFLSPSQVGPSFWVSGAPPYLAGSLPYRNIGFDGQRQDVTIDDIVRVEGRRTPDNTVAQRRFRFAFIIVAPEGSTPATAQLAKVDTYRQQFEAYFNQAASNHATAETSLQKAVKLSLYPSAGVVAGGSGSGAVSLATPAAAPLTVQFQSSGGHLRLPASVTIAAGASSASFSITGIDSGVEEVSAVPNDTSFETAFARVQVAGSADLKFVVVSPDPDSITVRLSDINRLPYPGARILASPSTNGVVSPATAMTDAQGQASFRWTPGDSDASELKLSVEAMPSVSATVSAGASVPLIRDVVSAASFETGIAIGAFQALRGARLAGGQTAASDYPWPLSLAGVKVTLNGSALPLLYVSDTQINFYVPQDAVQGDGVLAVLAPSGRQASSAVTVGTLQPAIFAAAGAPAAAGDYIEIYCTGLGATHALGALEQTVATPVVYLGGVRMAASYSGLSGGGLPGLYQVNVQVPTGLAAGPQPLAIVAGSHRSNEISILVR
jgi:uncharacterized protein (TIGR03437 family)